MPVNDRQVYIARKEWQDNDEFLIGIGVEGARPEGLWGTEEAAQLYVYVWKRRYDLAQGLIEMLRDQGQLLGEMGGRSTSGYVVTAPLMKRLPEEIDAFDEKVGNQILDFLAYYAKFAGLFTQVLKKCEKGKAKE